MLNFAEEIKNRRKEMKITQEDLAERAGFHLQTVRHIEEERSANPLFGTVEALLNSLGLELQIVDKGD